MPLLSCSPRRALRVLAFLLSTLPVLALPPAMYRGDAAHRANYDVPPLRERPAVKWKTPLAGEVFATPVVAGETVYVGSSHNRFYALALDTGAIEWTFEALGAVDASPAVADGIVYFGDFSGRLYALDARTGNKRWEHAELGERRFGAYSFGYPANPDKFTTDAFDLALASPVISGERVYYASGNGAILALDRTTGELQWRFVTNDVVHCAPAVADGRLYVGGWDGLFYCLDAATGEKLWTLPTGVDEQHHNQEGVLSAPVVEGDTVYFGGRDSYVYAVEAATGALRWKEHHGGTWVIASPVIVGDQLCYTTSDSRQFLVRDKRTGKLLHEEPTRSWSFSSPVAAGPVVYYATFAGDLNAFDTESRRVLWTWKTDAALRNELGFLGEDGAFDPNQTAFQPWDPDNIEALRQRFFSVGGIAGSPVPAGSLLLVPSVEGMLYALEERAPVMTE